MRAPTVGMDYENIYKVVGAVRGYVPCQCRLCGKLEYVHGGVRCRFGGACAAEAEI